MPLVICEYSLWRLFCQVKNKRGFLEGGFCKNVCLFWLRRSECQRYLLKEGAFAKICASLAVPLSVPNCQMYPSSQHPWVFSSFLLFSWSVTLGPTETPFAKPPFSWFLILGFPSSSPPPPSALRGNTLQKQGS